MKCANSSKLFNDVDSIVVEPSKFKAMLAIGEDAYTSLRIKNRVSEAWETLGVATTAATIAKSSAVAATFFAPSGFLAAIGIGSAVTPVGWVVTAAVVSGGAWVGVTRCLKKTTSKRVTVIPDFINTPMDVLALGLFDLIAPLALKIAHVDGKIDKSERKFINNYFVEEWGYDPVFVEKGIDLTESRLLEFSVKEVANQLAKFNKENPDCNYREMSKQILVFLRGIMESDGIIDEREEMAIEKVENIFEEIGRVNLTKNFRETWSKVSKKIENKVTSKKQIFDF